MKKYYFIILLFLISISCSTDDTSSSETDNESTEENGAVGNKTSVPDNNFEQWLIDNNYDDVLDNYALTDNLATIKKFCVEGMNIGDLKGLEDFTAVEEICVDGGDFDSIDLSNNTKLKNLKINNTSISSIDLSENRQLVEVDLSNNRLQDISLGNANNLKRLDLQGNKLGFINVSDLNSLQYLNSLDNNIECVVVESYHLYRSQSWESDEETSYSLYCPTNPNNPSKENYTYIPDQNFEEYLISEGYDDVVDEFVLTENISGVDRIYITGNTFIYSLKGIEDFKELTYLTIVSGQFYTLDLMNNTKLQDIFLKGSNLEKINLKENKNLELLVIKSDLKNIDLSNNTKLQEVDLRGNHLSEINLSNNSAIWYLVLAENNLKSLNITAQSYLQTLNISRNSLNNVYFNNVYNVDKLDVSYNNLEKLDLSPISSSLDYLGAANNNLSCIQVNENQLTEGGTFFAGSKNVDEGTTFSIDCNY